MRLCRLTSRATLRIAGADRARFLQGQLTQDVGALNPAAVVSGALLSPQGRVLAVTSLIERDEAIVLLVPTELAGELLERLRRYVLRSKVTLTLPGEALAVAAVVPESRAELDAEFGAAADGAHQRLSAEVSLMRLTDRALLIGPAAALAARLGAGATPASPVAFELAAIRAGEPAVFGATTERWVPQMLNLDLLGAISFTKGCYTGQEIVARTQNLGRIKRRMFRYRTPDPAAVPESGEPLTLLDAKVGEVVRAAPAASGAELLAVVNLEARDEPLESAGGARFEPAKLPYAVN
jgi:folate-binding protein YgfZ